MKPTPRILWNAKDSPTLPSGYGIIGKHLLPRLAARYGHDNIIIYAPVFQRDEVREWQGMRILPGDRADYGEDMVLDHYRRNDCNMLLQVGDWFMLSVIPQLSAENQIVWVQYAPFDFAGFPEWAKAPIRSAKRIVPFSKQAERAFREAGLGDTTVPAIWIGLDTDIWKPLDRREYPSVMRSLGFSEDGYNILIVAANQNRKYVREMLEAIALFRQGYPDSNPRLYLHSHVRGDRQLDLDLSELGLNDITTLPELYTMALGGFPEEHMAIVFSCSDLVLNTVMEGFGLVHTQAQAVGAPVVFLADGAGPELVKWGVQVPSYSTDRSQQLSKPVAHPSQIATGIETMYLEYQKGNRRDQNAVDWVRGNFNWDTIAEQWYRVIDETMEIGYRNTWWIPKPSEGLVERSRRLVEVRP